MERVLITSDIERCEKENDFDRFYFGSEFCPNLLPSIGDLKTILKRGVNFSLATSPMNDAGISMLKERLDFLQEHQSLKEVIVNDLGVAFFIRGQYPGCSVVFGRLISNLFTLPLKTLENKLQINSSLQELNIERVEFNYEDTEKILGALGRYSISIYTGLFNLSYAPACPWNNGTVFEPCKREGFGRSETIKNKTLGKEVVARANAFFLKTPLAGPADAMACNASRIIFQ